MDRCALFVDAGYALADGAMAVHGTRRRDSVSWDHAGLLKLLAGLARDRTGLPVLRCYWYETAPEGRRTAEHDALAEMPGLKLRLVNALPGRREGIESQLRRDLVTLAKSGAISDAFIASANEHIAEIVAEVQDLGLRVVILHIASDSGWTIPLPLRQECDDIVEISGVHLRSYVDLIKGAEPLGSEDQYKSAPVGAVTHHGLPAAALPAPAAIYQVQDLGYPAEHAAGSGQQSDLPSYLAAPQPAGAGEMARTGTAHSSSSTPQAQAHDPSQAQSQSAVNGAQPGGSSPSPGLPPYATATGFPGYQNGTAASYQVAAMPNGSGPGGVGPSHDGGAQTGMTQSGVDHNGAGQGAEGQNRAGTGHGSHAGQGSHAGHPGRAPGGDGQGGAGQAGAGQAGAAQAGGQHGGSGQNGVPANGAGRQGVPPNAFPAESGLNNLASVGYQQQNAYQRGPAQNGIDQNGSAPNGLAPNGAAGQNGAGYQPAGQNGAAQFGYPIGQPNQGANSGPQGGHQAGAADQGSGRNAGGQSGYQVSQQGQVPGGTPPSYAPTGPSQPGPSQSLAAHGGVGGPGQAHGGQQGHSGQPGPGHPGQPGQTGQPGQPQNGLQQVSYQHGQGGGAQSGARGGPGPGAYQQAGPQADPRARDPYGSAMQPQAPAGPDAAQSLAQGQYGYGAPPEVSFVQGQPGSSGQDQQHRIGFGQGPGAHPGQDAGVVIQPQYQVPQQAMVPLPAVRVQQLAIALPDAVKAAHAEGFSFGESVGRDAPGLWLEAVLARKPRMPSDLEARLLQGSVLPIDSLLHDEVRHSLRRGFWDALESARR